MSYSNKIAEFDNTQDPSIKKMLKFSMGYFFNVYTLVAFNNYVWTFYEGELGLMSVIVLWPIYIAIANVIFTIFSMVSNPLVGYLTDKPMKWTKKRGFHTPWIIIGGIPAIIFFFLLFTPPLVSEPENATLILIYYLIIVCIYDVFNSLLRTHSYGAFPAHFRGDIARRKAAFITQVFTFLSNFFTIMIWSQIIEPGNPASFTIAAFVSLIVLIISLAVFIPGSKESEDMKDRFIVGYETSDRISFFKTLTMALKQKNFMLYLLTYIAFMVAMGLMSMNGVNFVDDVLEEEQYIRTIGSILMLLTSVFTMPLWAKVAKKIGHSNMYVIGLASFGFSVLLYVFIVDLIGYYLVTLLSGITGAMYMIMLSPVSADCYDEITVMTGKHHEATLLGIRNLFNRVTTTIQSFLVAIIHVITVYDPNDLIHSNEALLGLRIIQGFIPFIFCVVGAFLFKMWFDMKGEKKQDIIEKMREMGL
jgi:Na+/melibiose symporter-like transporter